MGDQELTQGAVDQQRDHERLVEVKVRHINEAEKTEFKISEDATLQQVWDQAYIELKIAKNPLDVFQTGGDQPTSLMGHLTLTLKQARDQHVIKNYAFEIAAQTGGA